MPHPAAFGGDAGNPAISGNLADPDHDGISNLMEYAAGANPLDPNSRARQESSDLQTWTPLAPVQEILFDDGTTRTVIERFHLNCSRRKRSVGVPQATRAGDF